MISILTNSPSAQMEGCHFQNSCHLHVAQQQQYIYKCLLRKYAALAGQLASGFAIDHICNQCGPWKPPGEYGGGAGHWVRI